MSAVHARVVLRSLLAVVVAGIALGFAAPQALACDDDPVVAISGALAEPYVTLDAHSVHLSVTTAYPITNIEVWHGFTPWDSIDPETLRTGPNTYEGEVGPYDATEASPGPKNVHIVVDTTACGGFTEVVAWLEFELVGDTSAPAFDPDFEADASLDANGRAIIDWDSALDPDDEHELMGAGVVGYDYRTRRDAGAWSSWQQTSELVIALDGSHQGEHIDLEVAPRDAAGNVGATKSASLTVTGTGNICQPTTDGYPAQCVNPNMTEDFDDVDAELVPLEPDPSAQRRDASPGRRYYVDVVGGSWVTVRSRPQSLAIGNAHDGWAFDRNDAQDMPDDNAYRWGFLAGRFNDCTWIDIRRTNASGDVEDTGCGAPVETAPAQVGKTFNCDCTYATRLPVRNAHSECANVYPGVTYPNLKQECRDKIRAITHDDVDGGYHLGWRYVTNDGRYVMAKEIPEHGYSRGDGIWVFVPRDTFGRLCGRNLTTHKPECDNA
jgi:hypothetical protein